MTNDVRVGCEQTWQRLMRTHCMQLLQDIAANSHHASCTWFPRSPSPEDQVAMRRIKVQAEKISRQLLVLPIAVCMGQHVRLGRHSLLITLDDALFEMILNKALYA